MVPAKDCIIMHKRLSKGFKLDRVCSVISKTGIITCGNNAS